MIDRRLLHNLASLMSVQALNYLVPMMTLPFLARVLGRNHWGELAIAEAYSAYLSVLLEYGFGYSVTREIAKARRDTLARSSYLSSVLGAQAILALISLAATVTVGFTVPSLAGMRPLIFLGLALAIARSSFPIWYFQGMERMKYIALSNAAATFASAGATFVLVRSPADTFIPLRIRALAACLCTLAAYATLSRETPVPFPRLKHSLLALKDGWSLFLFRSAVSLYTTANVLLLGFFLPPSAVAIYAGPEKLLKAAMAAIGPITQTFYPRIAYELQNEPHLARRTVRSSAVIAIGGGMIVGIVMFLTAPWLVKALLGKGFEQSINVLRLMSFLPVVISVNMVLGIHWLLPLRMEKQYTAITVGAGFLNVLLALVLVPRYKAIGMTISVLVAESCVSAGIVVLLRARRDSRSNYLRTALDAA